MLNAKHLLADGANNTGQVSYLLGFEEPSNFTKKIKKHTGNTPTYFKEKLLQQLYLLKDLPLFLYCFNNLPFTEIIVVRTLHQTKNTTIMKKTF